MAERLPSKQGLSKPAFGVLARFNTAAETAR